MDTMWRLDEFQYDWMIPEGEVSVLDDSLGHEAVDLQRDEAIRLAHARGVNLVALRPGQTPDSFSCLFSKVTLPLRWEEAPAPEPPQVDERMWFEAGCGGRDFLLNSNGHTSNGRMLAWCPHQDHHVYSVSKSQMGEMSTETQYFVSGFLAGNEPEPPHDEDWNTTPVDEAAWALAVERFRESGSWSVRWDTCVECGCVLLPTSASGRCGEHSL